MMRVLSKIRAFVTRLTKSRASTTHQPGPTDEGEQADIYASARHAGTEADTVPSTSRFIDRAERAFHSASRISPLVEGVADKWETTTATVELLHGALAGLKVFSQILDFIGEVHPYVQIVTSVVNRAVVKPILDQDARDNEFDALLKEMIRTYDLVKSEIPPDLAGRDPTSYETALLVEISCETADCARFIEEEYIPSLRSFWARTISNTLRNGIEGRIQSFKASFATLHDDWRDGKLRAIDASEILRSLARVSDAGQKSQNMCLPETRVGLLDELAAWVSKPDGARIRFLLGVAGSGKSSIAHTVAVNHHAQGKLAAFFAFDRSERDRVPRRVLGTIAYNMALWNENYRYALARVLRGDQSLCESADISLQWRKLIVEPSRTLRSAGPLLIVIDAFDECSSSLADADRGALLQQLTSEISLLPSNVRLLVTSRSERDVMDATKSMTPIHLDAMPAHDDILVYVLDKLLGDGQDGLSYSQCDDLAVAADGLFQWAATACSLLKRKRAGSTMAERLAKYLPLLKKGVVSDDTGRRPSLSALYREVLEDTVDTELPSAIENFRSVMSLMLCASTPLAIDALQAIYCSATGSNEDSDTVGNVLENLGVVLEGTSDRRSPVRPMHTSFRDFLLDPGSTPWAVSDTLAAGHCIMAIGTVQLMAKQLTFNMCRLPSSCTRNSEVSDIQIRLSQLPAGLRYSAENWDTHTFAMFSINGGAPTRLASMEDSWFDLNAHRNDHWFSHLRTSGTATSLGVIRDAWRAILFDRFLFWLELLSVTGRVGTVFRTLEYLAAFFSLSAKDTDLMRFVSDATQFCHNFARVMVDFAPQIYLSALPLTPVHSLISASFLSRFSRLPAVHPSPVAWSSNSMPPKASRVARLAYSSDSRFVRIDDPLYGLRCWDSTTATLADVPNDLTWRYRSTRSQDGYLTVKINKCNIFVRSSRVGSPAKITVLGTERIRTFDVSPDGKCFVTGSSAGTVRLWDSMTGAQIGDTLEGLEKVLCTVFSPDGKEIAALFPHSTVRIWPIAPRLGDHPRYPYANFVPQPERDPATGREYASPGFRSTEPHIYIPEHRKHAVWTRGMRTLLGAEPISVDFAGTCHGTEWAECYRG